MEKKKEKQQSTLRTMLPWFLIAPGIAVVIANLGAIVDAVIHPEIPYFDREHLIVGTISGIVTLLTFGGITLFLYRSRLSARRQLEAEAACSASVRKYAELFERSSDAILFFGPDGRLIDINPTGVSMLGYRTSGEMVSRLAEADLFESNSTIEIIHGLLSTGDMVTNRATEVVTGDGNKLDVIVSASTEFDDDGEIRATSYIMKDMTGINRMQRKLAEKQKMDSIGRFASGIAHEFGNLMMTIQGNTEMAVKNMDDKDAAMGSLEQIMVAAEQATRLTHDLNMFSQKQPVHMNPVDINRIVYDLDGTLHMIAAEKVKVITELCDDIYIVEADYTSLERVIISLFLFLKDMIVDEGQITIGTDSRTVKEEDASRTPDLKEGKYAIIRISGDDAGMDPEELASLFEPYSKEERHVGSDLGLPMVYGIVRQHGGWLDIRSEPGRGSTFTVFLPVHEGFALNLSEASKEDIAELQGSGQKVLLVEDDEQVRSLIERMLIENGYQVFIATDATQAFSVFAREKGEIDIVFCDVALPGESGLSLAQNLSSYRKDLPVLLTSGYEAPLDDWQLIKDQGYTFLQKPFQLAELLASVRDALQREGNHKA